MPINPNQPYLPANGTQQLDMHLQRRSQSQASRQGSKTDTRNVIQNQATPNKIGSLLESKKERAKSND